MFTYDWPNKTVCFQCQAGSEDCGSTQTPVCCGGDPLIPAGCTKGMCVACKGTSGSTTDAGNNSHRGTCPNSAHMCMDDGSCS